MDRLLETLSIREASQKLNVSEHTLRFWEKEFKDVLIPFRTKGGQRRYTDKHLFIVEEIIKLKRRGFSLADIKNKLSKEHDRKSVINNSNSLKIDLLANEIAEKVKSAIYSFFHEENLD